MKRYFMVTCMRGHCGMGHGMEITFAFEAKNLLDAMDRAKKMPAVKHTRMICSGKEITEMEYNEYRRTSAYKRLCQR